MTVAVVRPNDTSAAQTLYAWAQDTVNHVGKSTHAMSSDLAGNSATRSNVESEMLTCRAVFFFGEGDWDALLAHNGPIVDKSNVGKA